MKLTLAIVATLVGALVTLMLVTFSVMAMGNAPASGQNALRAGLLVWSIGGVACAAGAIALMSTGWALTAAAIGALPIVAFVGVYVYESLSP